MFEAISVWHLLDARPHRRWITTIWTASKMRSQDVQIFGFQSLESLMLHWLKLEKMSKTFPSKLYPVDIVSTIEVPSQNQSQHLNRFTYSDAESPNYGVCKKFFNQESRMLENKWGRINKSKGLRNRTNFIRLRSLQDCENRPADQS